MIRNLISMTIVFILLTAFISCGGGGSGGSGGGDDSDDSDLSTSLACPDNDGDGYAGATCDGADCDDRDSNINPLAHEICGDNIDQKRIQACESWRQLRSRHGEHDYFPERGSSNR